MWNDGRTEEETKYLNEVIGREKLLAWTGNVAFAGFTAPKLLWLKKHEPENFAKIHKIMLPKDYIAYKLTGVFSTDVSDASGTLLFDVRERAWSEDMMDICDVYIEQLPQIYESYEMTGYVTPQAAGETGLSTKCAGRQAPVTMRRRRSAQEQSAAAAATFLWVPAVPCLLPAIHLKRIQIMRSMPSVMLTDIITLWDVCSALRPAISGGQIIF